MNYHLQTQRLLTDLVKTTGHVTCDSEGMRVRQCFANGYTDYTVAVGAGYLIKQDFDRWGRVLKTERFDESGKWVDHE